MIFRLAIRNLARNRWRSVLTASGIAVAVGLMIWMMSFIDGWMTQMVRGTTSIESLQVKIERQDYVDEPAIYRSFALNNALIDQVEKHPQVQASTARIKLYGLIGNERRSQVAQILGVDASRESNATPIESAVIQGQWLTKQTNPDNALAEVVLGEVLARQLRVTIGDELVVFLEAADGSLGNELFEVTGIVRTGNSAVDRQAAYVNLHDAQFLGALDGQVHELAIQIHDPAQADIVAEDLKRTISLTIVDDNNASIPLAIRSWRDVMPQISQMVEVSGVSNWIMYFIVYLVASLGIMNTQRMSALERRREFAVLMAIGVTPWQLFKIIIVETALLGLLGAIMGAFMGSAISLYHAYAGIDLAAFSDQTTFSYMGVSFSERIYTTFTVANLIEPVLAMLVVAMLCALWPAAQGARIIIPQALSGRN